MCVCVCACARAHQLVDSCFRRTPFANFPLSLAGFGSAPCRRVRQKVSPSFIIAVTIPSASDMSVITQTLRMIFLTLGNREPHRSSILWMWEGCHSCMKLIFLGGVEDRFASSCVDVPFILFYIVKTIRFKMATPRELHESRTNNNRKDTLNF